jgi:hypothetical protein
MISFIAQTVGTNIKNWVRCYERDGERDLCDHRCKTARRRKTTPQNDNVMIDAILEELFQNAKDVLRNLTLPMHV